VIGGLWESIDDTDSDTKAKIESLLGRLERLAIEDADNLYG
jgi:hypothetical protein